MVASLNDVFRDEADLRVTALFVDDGSRDHTWREIQRVRAEGGSIEVGGIRLEHNQGKGMAQAIALRELAASPGLVVLMDSDGQHDPGRLPDALRRCRESRLPQIAQRTDYRRGKASSLGTLGLSLFSGLTGVRFDPTLGEYVVLPERVVRLLSRNSQLGVMPIVPLIQATSPECETFASPVLDRSDGSRSTRWTVGQLWHKAILLLLANPWAMLPRVALAIVMTVLILGSYGMVVGVTSIVQGTFLGVGSVIVAMVVIFSVLAGLQLVTLGLLVVLSRSNALERGSSNDFDVLEWREDRV